MSFIYKTSEIATISCLIEFVDTAILFEDLPLLNYAFLS